MFKLKDIKNKIKTDLTQPWWVVISGFDQNNGLLFVKWIIFSDEKRSVNLKKLYDDFILPNKKLKTLVVDFVENLEEITDASKLKSLNLKEKWLFIWDTANDNGTFILPNTKWLENFATAYKAIKQKVKFSSWNVNVYTFTTKRFVI